MIVIIHLVVLHSVFSKKGKTRDKSEVAFDHDLELIIRACLFYPGFVQYDLYGPLVTGGKVAARRYRWEGLFIVLRSGLGLGLGLGLRLRLRLRLGLGLELNLILTPNLAPNLNLILTLILILVHLLRYTF